MGAEAAARTRWTLSFEQLAGDTVLLRLAGRWRSEDALPLGDLCERRFFLYEHWAMAVAEPQIEVRELTMAYGDRVIQRDLSFTVGRRDIFIIMGGSGCGKSTLLRHLIGLMRPARGDVYYEGQSFWGAGPEAPVSRCCRCARGGSVVAGAS